MVLSGLPAAEPSGRPSTPAPCLLTPPPSPPLRQLLGTLRTSVCGAAPWPGTVPCIFPRSFLSARVVRGDGGCVIHARLPRRGGWAQT